MIIYEHENSSPINDLSFNLRKKQVKERNNEEQVSVQQKMNKRKKFNETKS